MRDSGQVIRDSGLGIRDSGLGKYTLSTFHYQLSTINYPLSTVNYPLSTVHCQLSTNPSPTAPPFLAPNSPSGWGFQVFGSFPQVNAQDTGQNPICHFDYHPI